MNPNHGRPPAPKEREPLPLDDAMLDLLAAAPTPDDAHRLEALYAKHGTALAVYLGLADVDPYAADVAEKFENELAGVYANPEALVDDTIASFGWTKDLDRLLEGDPLLRAVVTFDRAAIRALAQDHYQIVSVEGALYVFQPLPVGGNRRSPRPERPQGPDPARMPPPVPAWPPWDENRAVAPRWPRKGQETATAASGAALRGRVRTGLPRPKERQYKETQFLAQISKHKFLSTNNQKENIMNEQQGQLAGESRTNEQHLKTLAIRVDESLHARSASWHSSTAAASRKKSAARSKND